MEETCPEVVSTVESFARNVVYIPHSALGRSPVVDPDSGTLCIRPRDIKPFWASVPLLYFFYERGLVPYHTKLTPPDVETVSIQTEECGDILFVTPEGWSKPMQVPKFYLGARLKDPQTGIWFDLPSPEEANVSTTEETKPDEAT